MTVDVTARADGDPLQIGRCEAFSFPCLQIGVVRLSLLPFNQHAVDYSVQLSYLVFQGDAPHAFGPLASRELPGLETVAKRQWLRCHRLGSLLPVAYFFHISLSFRAWRFGIAVVTLHSASSASHWHMRW